jgi:hypothetical protein
MDSSPFQKITTTHIEYQLGEHQFNGIINLIILPNPLFSITFTRMLNQKKISLRR